MDLKDFFDSVGGSQNLTNQSETRNRILRASHLLTVQRLKFPSAPAVQLTVGSELLDCIASFPSGNADTNGSVAGGGVTSNGSLSSKNAAATLEQIGAHFCRRCGAHRTADNFRVRFTRDRNIARRIAKLKKKDQRVLTSSSSSRTNRKKERGLTKNEKKYLQRYGDYATTRKTTCLVCKHEKSENVMGKPKSCISVKKSDARVQNKLHSEASATILPKGGKSEKKATTLKEKQKSSVKKCSDIRKMLLEGSTKDSDDQRKSLKDFLSLL